MFSREQLFTISKPKWEWHKVNSQLRTRVDGKMASYSLKPQIAFESNVQSGKRTRLRFKVSVDTQKSLQYENQVGWNWHKSSNLPAISLKVELRHPESDVLYPLPENLQARIFAVKIVVNTLERQIISHIDDIGIRGPNRVQLKDGCGIFNGIRFQTTSYNNQGVKFYLLIAIFLKDESSQQLNNIVCSVMSPPIFVDSRKSARDYQEKRFLSFVEIFDPFLMKKQFAKKSIREKNEFQIKIQNSMDGLYNYLTAPNIRHKVKHPFFLSVKFSNVFRIMLNQKYNQNGSDSKQINNVLVNFQQNLVKEIGKNKKNSKSNSKMGKPYLISVSGQCNNQKKTKIYECLQFLNCKSIQFAKYGYQIGSSLKNIVQVGDIIKGYNEVYDELTKITQKQIQVRKKKGDFVGQQISLKDQSGDKFNAQLSKEQQRKKQSNNNKSQSKSELSNIKRQIECQQIDCIQIKSRGNIKQEIIQNHPKNECLKTRDPEERAMVSYQPNIQNHQGLAIKNYLMEQNMASIQMQKIPPPPYYGYYQNLIYQIDVQNSMLQMILQQNLAMRERLIGLMLHPSHELNGNSIDYSIAYQLSRNSLFMKDGNLDRNLILSNQFSPFESFEILNRNPMNIKHFHHTPSPSPSFKMEEFNR